MIKNIGYLIVLLLAAVLTANCEKDDICDGNTPTTPRMIIEFYDNASQTELKPVLNLDLISDSVDVDGLSFTNVTRIEVPLRTMNNTTMYEFVSTTAAGDGFADLLQFNYTRRDVFVSRACGYKTLFDLYNDTEPETPPAIFLNNSPLIQPGAWIKGLSINNFNIENETDVHVQIYH